MKNKKNTGVSTVEYLVMVSAVTLVVMLFTTPNGFFSTALNQTMTSSTDKMVTVTDSIFF